jgi:hypothetical protein
LVRTLGFSASGFPQRVPQDELDLAVQAAQVVVRPALNGIEYVAIDPEQKGLPFSHGRY